NGHDLVLDMPVTFSQAALGAEIEIPTLEGGTKVRVPAGSQTRTLLRLRGKGVPDLETGRRGDLLVRILVVTPQRLTAEEKRLLEKLDELLGEYTKRPKSFFDKVR
ncbi:MAG: DnaJ C-terminal domain-containing protein, partial [Candidatus Thermoplasmatota archaeon]